MAQFETDFLDFINSLQPHDWILILAAVIVVGALCMKGTGNQSHF